MLLVTPQTPLPAKSMEFPNVYIDYLAKWSASVTKYNHALFEASYKALETFYSTREGPAQKIQNTMRAAFDTTLRNRLGEDDLATSMSEYVDSWANLRKSSGGNGNTKFFSDLAWYQNHVLDPVRDNNVYRTPSEEIEIKGRFNLLHYKSKSPPIHKTPILVIYSLINRHYILDLLPKVSVIRNLMDQGFDVYSTDLGKPTS